MKEQILLDSIKRVFQEQADIALQLATINPRTALNISKLFFYNYEVNDLDKESQDNDMLLFQYGSCHFENQKEFYLDITRQFKINDDQDEFYQLSLTLFYDHNGFEQIKSYNSWSTAFSELTSWSQMLSGTEGFTKAMDSEITHYKIVLSTT